MINEHIEPSLGAIKLRKLDVATLDSFYRALTKKGLAPATVRQAHADRHSRRVCGGTGCR